MNPASSMQEIDRDAGLGTPEELLREVRDHLLRILRSLNEEIRAYPTPIPRCDAQFNHLFEQRARLYRILERVEAQADAELARGDCIGLLEEFAASAAHVGDAAEQEIRARVGAELARFGS